MSLINYLHVISVIMNGIYINIEILPVDMLLLKCRSQCVNIATFLCDTVAFITNTRCTPE